MTAIGVCPSAHIPIVRTVVWDRSGLSFNEINLTAKLGEGICDRVDYRWIEVLQCIRALAV